MDQKMLEAIEQLKRGEEAGFNYIYSQTYKLVYFQARGHLRNEEDVQDLVQAVYLSVYRSIHTLQDPNAFYGWLKTIVRNQAGMILRKFREDVSLEEGMEGKLGVDQLTSFDMSALPEASMEQKAVSEIVADIIEELPELQKSALLMYYYENMKVEEIAEVMGCSAGTVKSRLNYARKRIGERVEEIEKKDGIRLHALAIPTLVLAFKWLFGKPVKAMAATDMYQTVSTAAEVAAGVSDISGLSEMSGMVMTEDGSMVYDTEATLYTDMESMGNPVTDIATDSVVTGASVAETAVTADEVATAGAVAGTVKKTGGLATKLAGLSMKAKAAMIAGTLVVGGGAVAVPTLVSGVGNEDRTIEAGLTPEITEKEPSGDAPVVTTTQVLTPTPAATPHVMSDAEKLTLENIRYEIIDGEVTVLGLTEGSNLAEVVIPPQIELNPVTRIDESAFYKSHITGVTFPETLTEIGDSAFYETHIKEVYIPAGITKLGAGIFKYSGVEKAVFEEGHTMIPNSCFERCNSLKEVVLPSTLKTIDDNAFLRCGFTEIVFPEELEKIGKQAFFGCEGLEEIVLPDNVTEIGVESFYGCKRVKRLVLSKNLNVISNNAFGATESLIKIDIPEGVVSIEGGAFRFSEILEVSFPVSLSYIDDSAFAQNFGQGNPMKFVYAPAGSYAEGWAVKMGFMAEQTVTEEAPRFSYTVTDDTAVITGMDKDAWDHLIIPREIDGYKVTRIAENAFVDCDIRILEIPETITQIDDNAIRTTETLEAVKFYGGEILFLGTPIRNIAPHGETILYVPADTKVSEWAGSHWRVHVYKY